MSQNDPNFQLELIASNEDKCIIFNPINFEMAEFSSHDFDQRLISEKKYQRLNVDKLKNPELAKEIYQWAQSTEICINTSDSINDKNSIHENFNTITINITQICNLECLYCAAGGDGTYGNAKLKTDIEKVIPKLALLVERLALNSNFKITFLGGEPLLYPKGIRLVADYMTQVSVKKQINIQFNLVTNGTIMNDEIIELINKFNIQTTISLDGPPQINDTLRPAKTKQLSTQNIIDNINLLNLKKISTVKLSIHGVYGHHNLEISKAWAFFSELPVSKYEFAFNVFKNDIVSNNRYISEMEKIFELAWLKGQEIEIRKIKFIDDLFTAIDNTFLKFNYCGSLKSYLILDSEADFYTCPWTVGVKEEQVTDLNAFNQRNDLIDLHNCQTCWVRHLCGGGCMYINQQNQGDKHIKDSLFCERTQSLIASALVYYNKARA